MRDRLGAVFSHLRTYANNNTGQTPNRSGDINNVFEYSDVLSALPPRKNMHFIHEVAEVEGWLRYNCTYQNNIAKRHTKISA